MRRWAALSALAAVLVMAGPAGSEGRRQPPGAEAQPSVRIWGHPQMRRVVEIWSEGFRRRHPGVRVEAHLFGSATAIPGLYSGEADIALLGRENDITDDNGFGRVKHYPPMRLDLLAGGVDTHGKSPALVILVRQDNPLAQLSLAQLDAIFGCERRRGLAAVRTWGDLGLGGAWAKAPIRLHAFDLRTGPGDFFQRRVLLGSHKLQWDRLTEHEGHGPGDAGDQAGREVADAVRRDPYAVGLATAADVGPGLKALALAERPEGPYQAPTAEAVATQAYPLSRRVYAFVDRPPGRPVAPLAAEFLSYALSAEGQADVVRAGGYLPLPPREAEAQRLRLAQP